MTIRSILLACVLALGTLPASAQDRMERVLANKVLRVGTTMDTPVDRKSTRLNSSHT